MQSDPPYRPLPGMYNVRYDVKTTPHADGIIEQTIGMIGPDGVRHHIIRSVIHTQEEQMRAALIALGWTPPAPREIEITGQATFNGTPHHPV